ncbi:MAG: PilZ domain-containing protein [Lysobacteraceae bacterium]|nr:MAG: PilZ domain-containing protein [Xanthomonadaceae bacterium]
MNEKRRLPRKRPGMPLQVIDAMTGDVAGRLGNLSLEGMMLVTQRPMVEDALYQFLFHLPDSHGRLHPVEVGVHEQWTDAGSERGHVWTGFRFIDIGPDDERILREWLMHAEDFVA